MSAVVNATKPCPLCGGRAVYERTLNEIHLVRCAACTFVYSDVDTKVIEDANFHFDDNLVDVAAGYAAQAWQRLQAVRGAVDPDCRLLANHAV